MSDNKSQLRESTRSMEVGLYAMETMLGINTMLHGCCVDPDSRASIVSRLRRIRRLLNNDEEQNKEEE